MEPPPIRTSGTERLGEVVGHWSLDETHNGFRLEVIDPAGGTAKQVAIFNRDWSRARVHQCPPQYQAPPRIQSGWVVCDLMEPLLQWWLSQWLAEKQIGFVIHASSVSIGGAGFAFVGESGAGKSTIARLAVSKNERVLNDERSLLWRDGSGWKVAGTPWHGEYAQVLPDSVPLQAFFLLAKASREEIAPLAPAWGLSMILQQAFMPLWCKASASNIIGMVQDVLAQTRWGELRFRKTPAVIDFLRSQMGEPLATPA